MSLKDKLDLGLKLVGLLSIILAFLGYRKSVKNQQLQVTLQAIHESRNLPFQQALNRVFTLRSCQSGDTLSFDCLATIYGNISNREILNHKATSFQDRLYQNQVENELLFAVSDDVRFIVNHYDYSSILYEQNIGVGELFEESMCEEISLLLVAIELLPQEFKHGLPMKRIEKLGRTCP